MATKKELLLKKKALLEERKTTLQQEQRVGGIPKGVPVIGGLGSVPQSQFQQGERNLLGNVLERPGAANREAIRGATQGTPAQALRGILLGPLAATGAKAGALGPQAQKRAGLASVDPTASPTFQEQFSEQAQGKGGLSALLESGKVPQALRGPLTVATAVENFKQGLPAAAVGFIADFLTNPADIALELLTAGGGKSAKLASAVDDPLRRAAGVTKRTVQKAPKLREGVKTIVNNKNILKYTDDAGQVVATGLPQTADHAVQATVQVKKALFDQWDNLLQQTGKGVPLDDTFKALDDLAESTAAVAQPALRRQALAMKKQLQSVASGGAQAGEIKQARQIFKSNQISPKQADDLIASFNQQLKPGAIRSAPPTAAGAQVMDKSADALRKSLDETVSSLTGKEFQPLKTGYGSVRELETTMKLAQVRAAKQSFAPLVGPAQLSELGIGAITAFMGHPGFGSLIAGKGALGVAAKLYNKNLTSVNRNIAKMFKAANKVQVKEARSIFKAGQQSFGGLKAPTAEAAQVLNRLVNQKK